SPRPAMNFKSFLALATIVGGALAQQIHGTAVTYTITDTTSLPCLGAGVPANRVNIVKNVLANGNYVVVPGLPLANCGSAVFYLNQVDSSTSYTAYAVGVSPDSTLGLGPAAWAESAGGATSFNAVWVVSPTNGR
ncbi:unnamed protein product, partial [Mycena citricolor]